MQQNELIKSKHRTWNPKTREALVARGIEVTVPILIHNLFYCDSLEAANLLNVELVAAGYSVEPVTKITRNDVETSWEVAASMNLVPELSALNSMTDRCIDTAVQTGADYDGWYVAIG